MITSVYIHIPFCKNICSYCDFSKLLLNEDLVTKYLEELEREIDKNYKKEKIKTIYIGGGTPSALKEKHLQKLFSITKKFKLSKTYEFTFECNINDITENLLKTLKENKVNRLSIGVQSFNKKILETIGRKEYPTKEKIDLAKKYFENINIDLIYGVNNETIKDLKKDLESFLELDIKHISIYSLILENNTILKINNYQEIDDDTCRKMYDLIRKTLTKNNYIHYEISSFCKKGYASKHNLAYWNNDNYYGFGLGASGYIKNIRYTNTRNINKYLNHEYILEQEVLDDKITMEYEMILNLRKIKGISKNKFKKKYNLNIKDVFNISKLKENKTNYYIAKKDLFVQNSILCDFVDI